jgi:MarC family membrane protein
MHMDVLAPFFAATLAILNPVGQLPVFIAATSGVKTRVRRYLALLIGAVICVAMVASLVFGRQVLHFFGVSLPAFEIAGGIIILFLGLHMVRGNAETFDGPGQDDSETSDFRKAEVHLREVLVPVAIPMFVGPGAISTILLFASQIHTVEDLVGGALVLIAVSALSTVVMLFSEVISRALGVNGLAIATRLFGLIIVAMAVQFVLSGLSKVGNFIDPGALQAAARGL